MQPYAPNAPSKAEILIAALKARSDDALCKEAAGEIERLREQEYRLAARIHQQRVSLRENWEIIEMRCQNWMGSREGRRRFINLLKRHHEILRQLRSFEEVRTPWWRRWL